MGWFTEKVDEDTLQWQLSHFEWLALNLKDNLDLKRIRLVLPTNENFPVKSKKTDERAEGIFKSVQKHFALESWPCSLKCFEEVHDIARKFSPITAQPEEFKGAAGLFEITEDSRVIIRYKLEQVEDPISLIATFAHELCHYILARIPVEPPCGWKNHESLADLSAIFFGFGIFLANTSFRFKQWHNSQYQGWSAKRQGYLSEEELSLALSLFCIWKNIDSAICAKHLSTNPKHFFKCYTKDIIRNHPDAGKRLSAISQ